MIKLMMTVTMVVVRKMMM